MRPLTSILTAAALFALFGAACSSDAANEPVIDPGDDGNYAPNLDPANFVEGVDNPFFPMTPGSRWVYESADGRERIEVVVLAETRDVLGITATIVHDTVTEDGGVIEDTFDWYAQDRDGNVWYLGEDSKELAGGAVVSTKGSWEAGLAGAQPGIIMHAEPRMGVGYRQEYYPGEAEDLAQVVRLDGEATVPFGSFSDLLVIEEWNPLDPDVREHKYYGRGIGVVLEQKVEGGDERVELISFERPQ